MSHDIIEPEYVFKFYFPTAQHKYISHHRARGQAIFTIPYIGYLRYFVRTPVGFTLLIIIPATLLIITEIRNIMKELKKTRKRQAVIKAERADLVRRGEEIS